MIVFTMKRTQSAGTHPLHQRLAEGIKFKTGGQSIEIGFTDQKLSPHAGTATFWAFLRQSGWIELVENCLPHPIPASNYALMPVSKVLSFIQGLLCGAKKLTHVAYLRRDPLVPELLGIKRVASQSVLSSFFQVFSSAGRNLACFGRQFQWCLERLPNRREGYALDLDSTRLLHEDGHQEGGRGVHPRGNQTVFASAAGGLERSAFGGGLLAATGQQQLRQQRREFLPGFVGSSAIALAVAGGPGRFGFLCQ